MEKERCRQGERMGEKFVSRKELSNEELVGKVPWHCRLVFPPRFKCIAITENRSGRETSRVI